MNAVSLPRLVSSVEAPNNDVELALFTTWRRKAVPCKTAKDVAQAGWNEVCALVADHNYTLFRLVSRFGRTPEFQSALREAILEEALRAVIIHAAKDGNQPFFKPTHMGSYA